MPFDTTKGITISKVDDALTKFYIPRMWDMISTTTPGLEYFKDLGPVVDWSGPGYKGHFKTRQKSKKGVVGGRVGRLPSAGAPTFTEPEVEYTVFRNLIQFEWDAQMRTSMERYDKVKRLIESAVEDCGDEFRRRLNTYMYTKDNVVAIVSSATHGSDTLTLKSPHIHGGGTHGTVADHKDNGGCQYLEPGDQILVEKADGSNEVILTIESVDHAAGTVVVEAMDATSAGICDAGAKVFFASSGEPDETNGLTAAQLEQTDKDCGLDGIGDILDDPTNYLGKPRTGFWNAVDQHNSGTNRALSLVLIDKLLGQMNDQRFIYPDTMILNTGMFHEFNDLAEKNHAFFNQGDLPGGHSPQVRKKYFTVKTTMAQGDLTILVDKYAPIEQVTIVDSQSIGYANVYKEAEAKDDGSFLRHADASYDVWHGWTRWAGQFFAMSPAAVGRLNDITQDIRNL